MEAERRKRKIENEEESEEKQMEMFFALVKSTKDVRDRLSKRKEEEKAKGVWNPTFIAEDFIDDQELARINISHPPGGSSEKEKEMEKELPEAEAENENKEKASDNLDLTLSL
ncbi:hypothetical protein TanjilG_17042 [Lupinus angustifolius]|uniref:protein NIM1-INTERACTING 1 n=1 Tax=Lupinus angustifolius TaxID=3871 RepID=UPI00090E6FD4|nr:PREDICTED: protein NIM1-INTERACTING 1 [Lupinus angustifolius]OIV91082.1 hypothetical protein TanjilG_17042 [Lupinus angustifolius]